MGRVLGWVWLWARLGRVLGEHGSSRGRARCSGLTALDGGQLGGEGCCNAGIPQLHNGGALILQVPQHLAQAVLWGEQQGSALASKGDGHFQPEYSPCWRLVAPQGTGVPTSVWLTWKRLWGHCCSGLGCPLAAVAVQQPFQGHWPGVLHLIGYREGEMGRAGTRVQLQSYFSSHQFQASPFHVTALWYPQRLENGLADKSTSHMCLAFV